MSARDTEILTEIRDLLKQIRDTTAATAIVVEAAHAQQMQPVLERRHLEVQQKAWLAESERERERLQVAAELERTKRPSLWAGGAGAGVFVREGGPPPPLPEGEDTEP